MTSHRIAMWSSGSRVPVGALDAQRREVLADAGQRPLVQEAGQVVGGVGQQLAAADADEQVEIFAARGSLAGRLRGVGEIDMREAERRSRRRAVRRGGSGDRLLGACPSRTASIAYSDPRRASISSDAVT